MNDQPGPNAALPVKGRTPIRLAVAGLGNCAASLLQGVEYYRDADPAQVTGLMHYDLGGYRPGDIRIVAAFDIDRRKVGRDVAEALLAPPNCARPIGGGTIPPTGVAVQMGPILDGVAPHMAGYPDERTFRPADAEPVDVAAVLRESGAEVLVNYLPVGSEGAVHFYAEAALAAGAAFVNCVPVFLASEPAWAARFEAAGLPVLGDDIKAQLGATITHRALARLFESRGVKITRTYQLNTGGNTDFLNMLERGRLASKKVSKTEAVQSQLAQPLAGDNIHIGPSDYVPWLNDNKVCFIRMEGEIFGGMPVHVDVRLSVEDSPNSAGVALDAIRCAKLALDRGMAGALPAASAFLMKHPPEQFDDEEAWRRMEAFIRGEP